MQIAEGKGSAPIILYGDAKSNSNTHSLSGDREDYTAMKRITSFILFTLLLIFQSIYPLQTQATVNVETTVNRYQGTNATGPFPYQFRVYSASDLKVIRADSGAETVLNLNTDYTVSGVGASLGGSITLTRALSPGSTLTILRAMPYLQGQNYTTNQAITAKSLNDSLDKLGMQIQQVQEATKRSVQLPRSSSLPGPYAQPSPSTLLGWDSTGSQLRNYGMTSPISVPNIDHIGNYNDSLAEAVSTIGSGNDLLLISHAISVSSDLTVPPGINLWIAQGGRISVAAGVTLTVGRLTAGPYQIFEGEGSVVFSPGSIDQGYLQWRGVTLGDPDAAEANTANINKALSDLSGHRVYVPDGDYWISGPIYPKAGTTMEFAGWSAVIKMSSPAAPQRIINTNGESHITIRGGKIDGHNDVDLADGMAHQCISIMNESSYVTIENMLVANCGQYGIMYGDDGQVGPPSTPTHSGGNGLRIVNNTVDMNAAMDRQVGGALLSSIGIEMYPKGPAGWMTFPGPIITGNHVYSNNGKLNVGIKVNSSYGGIISNNIIEGVSRSTSTGGIDVADGNTGLVAADNVIRDCELGIAISGAANDYTGLRSISTIVSQNSIYRYNQYGIYAGNTPIGVQLHGNVIDVGGGTGTLGIYMLTRDADAQNLVIQNNQLVGGGIKLEEGVIDGVPVGYGFPRCKVEGNSVAETTSGNGIYADKAHRGSFKANTLYKIHASGMMLDGTYISANENKVHDANVCNGENIDGIRITGNYPELLGNQIENLAGGSGHATYGIRLENADFPILRSNRITNAVTNPFYLATATNVKGEHAQAYFGTVAAASDAEKPIFVAPSRCGVVYMKIVNGADMTQSDVDYNIFYARNKGSAGTGETDFLGISSQVTGGAAFAAFDSVNVGPLPNDAVYELASDDVVAFRKEHQGAGRATTDMLIGIEYLTY